MGKWDTYKDKPFDKWTPRERAMWMDETVQLMRQVEMIKIKLIQYAHIKGWMRMSGK